MFEYYGGWATKVDGYIPPIGPDAMSLVVKEPMGVAVGITPWNYPMMMAVQKVAPAIAAGCTFILKPAEQTPLTALEIPKILEEAGLPAGVLQVLTGFGETAGAPLVDSPLVDKVGFTGSRDVGKIIMKSGRRHPEARDAGARRQVAEHRVRRRRVRRGDRGLGQRHLLEPGRDLLGGLARVHRAAHLRRRARQARRAREGRPGRRRDRPATTMGPLVSQGAAGARAALHRHRREGDRDRRAGRRARRTRSSPAGTTCRRPSSPTRTTT